MIQTNATEDLELSAIAVVASKVIKFGLSYSSIALAAHNGECVTENSWHYTLLTTLKMFLK